jgi:hypothetical protein
MPTFSLRTLARTLAFSGLTFAAAVPAARASENISLFRLDTGLVIPYGPDIGTWGVGGSVEPKFTILDAVVVGLRLEGAAHIGGKVGDSSVEMSQWASSAFLAKGEYYLFPLSSVRPFAGFGAGIFNMGGQNVSAGAGGGAVSQEAGRYFGVAPQVGIELGRMRLAVGYNAILGADIEVKQQVSTGGSAPKPVKASRNFVTFELGVRWGGGVKTPAPAPAAPAVPAVTAP